MFEHFTMATREVVVRAADEARGRGDAFIGAEHLLLGLLTEGGATGRMLISGGLTRDVVHARLGPEAPGEPADAGQLPFTVPAKRSLERAADHASAAGDEHVTPEHLLLGIADAAEGVTEELLRAAGVELSPPADAAP